MYLGSKAMMNKHFGKQKVREEALISFFRQLSTLIKAGIPLFQALIVVSEQTTDSRLKKILEGFKSGLREGKSLAENMDDYQEVFSPFIVSTVSVGEAKGSLGDSLDRVSRQLLKIRDLRNKVLSALTYPALLVTVGVGVLIIMAVFVLPKFIAIFEEMEIRLPAPTRFIVMVNQFLSAHYLLLFIFLVIAAVAVILSYRTNRGRHFFDRGVLSFPIVGKIMTSAYASRFGSTFGTLYSGGIPILDALQLSKGVFGNVLWQEDIDSIGNAVKHGESFANAVSRAKTFPAILRQMLAVGAESSAIDSLAIEAADFYEEEAENILQKQLALLEPMALVLIAVVVAFMAAAVLLPMFSMSSGIHT